MSVDMVSKKVFIFFVVSLLLAASAGLAPGNGPALPGPKTKCPVCGMFVAKYPDYLAQVIFKDGSSYFFDGPKDMFKYLLNLKKYNPGKSRTDVDAIYVTDYYRVAPVDGTKTFYVLGSDVYGPMGKELIPFEKEPEAGAFMKDHRGKKILIFQDITDSLVRALD
jgi:copper chaperone NosL